MENEQAQIPQSFPQLQNQTPYKLNQSEAPRIILTVVFILILLVVGGYLLTIRKNYPISQSSEQKTRSTVTSKLVNSTFTASPNPVNPIYTSLVYAYNQYTILNSDYNTLTPLQTKVFKSDINNQNKTELSIGYFLSTRSTDPYNTKGFLYKTSPGGKYLFRISHISKSIEVASAQQPNSFNKIVEISQGTISNVTISPSGNKIAYIIRDSAEEKLFITNIDKGGQTFIKVL